MHLYRNLTVWRRSRAAALETYRVTSPFPEHERFGLTAQLRRAALSVCVNIVEGSKRLSQRDFAHFLNIAEGSAAEVGFLLEMSIELGFASRQAAAKLAAEFAEIERMLYALRKRTTQR